MTRLRILAGLALSAALAAPAPADASALTAAGQRVIFSYRGLVPPHSLLHAIGEGEAAGVIFFSDNVASRTQLRAVAQELQAAAPRRLLLMTDQEGGVVRRLPGSPARSEKQIGLAAHPVTAARTAGTFAARNLRSADLDVNLAPVLDVFRHAGNFIDEFGRSYGMDPRLVARLGGAFVAAQQQGGVAATVKHFPGLGAASRFANTDAGPVTLGLSQSTVRDVDELPYQRAIAAGAKLVMLSWARYPAFVDRPAGLSRTIVNGELRKRLGFKGVTVTDALEAGALQRFGSIGNRALSAVHAGMDLLLCSGRSVAEGYAAVHALAGALRGRHLDPVAFRAAVARVRVLRRSLP